MSLEPIQKTRLYSKIIEAIKEQIRTGKYKPGDKLPSERNLAKVLKVGRSSVREAVTVLESIGILLVKPGEGTFVRDCIENNSMEMFFESFSIIWDIEPQEILDLLAVRKILEPQSAALSAINATENDLLELNNYINGMKNAAQKKEVGEEFDYKFHYVIARSTKNKVLLNVLHALSDMMYKGQRQTRWMALSDPKRVEDVITDHTRIKEALEKRNSEEAQSCMAKHLENVESNFRRFIKGYNRLDS